MMKTENPEQTESTPASRVSPPRRPVTLVIRAFVNDDGELYGMVNEPGARAHWQATFSQFSELVELVCARLPVEQMPEHLSAQLTGRGPQEADNGEPQGRTSAEDRSET